MTRTEIQDLHQKLTQAVGSIETNNFKETYYLPLTPAEVEAMAQIVYVHLLITSMEDT